MSKRHLNFKKSFAILNIPLPSRFGDSSELCQKTLLNEVLVGPMVKSLFDNITTLDPSFNFLTVKICRDTEQPASSSQGAT